jgi:hypothetical protein
MSVRCFRGPPDDGALAGKAVDLCRVTMRFRAPPDEGGARENLLGGLEIILA